MLKYFVFAIIAAKIAKKQNIYNKKQKKMHLGVKFSRFCFVI